MKIPVLLVMSLLLHFSCFAADAKDVDGNHLLENCTASVQFMDNGSFGREEQASKATWCTGYVTGVLQAFDLSRKLSDQEHGKLYPCLEGITSKQATRVIVKYLRENPEKLQGRAVMLSLAALQRAFPCN